MKKNGVFILCIFVSLNAFTCEIVDLSEATNMTKRTALFNNMNASGVRLGWNGMKEHNKKYGLGGVNEVMHGYEKKLCSKFRSGEFRSAYPEVKVEVHKTDFKGYYITCTPKKTCQSIVMNTIDNVPKPMFRDGAVFDNSKVKADNYIEGYMKGRIAAVYPEELYKDKQLAQFIRDEIQQAIKTASGASDLTQLDPTNKIFRDKLAKNVDIFRSKGIEYVDEKFRRLVLGVDTLLEIPYASSSNIDKDLSSAISGGTKLEGTPYTLSTAQSGDDMFIVVKKDGALVRVVGADAKGLGVLNNTTRYEEFLKHMSGPGISNISDIKKLSMNAILSADSKMENSFGEYIKLLEKELKASPQMDMDELLARAHMKYADLIEAGDTDNMQIRAGAISDCAPSDNTCIMDRITNIHNNLKTMEAAGVNKHFGTSCVSSEYWVLKMGLKAGK